MVVLLVVDLADWSVDSKVAPLVGSKAEMWAVLKDLMMAGQRVSAKALPRDMMMVAWKVAKTVVVLGLK